MKKGLLLVIILCFLMLFLVGCGGGNNIDLSNFAEIKITGYDGKGTASLNINWDMFEETVFTKAELGTFTSLGKIVDVEDSIEYSLDKTGEISNGDTVTLHVKWDKEVAKKYKLKLSASKKTVKAKDLEVLTEIDLFADVHIDYEGVAPEARAIVRNASSDAFLKNVNYKADNTRNLRNGDTLTITASITPEAAEKNGYTIGQTQKAYTVSGIDEYIREYNDIDSETFGKMDKQARDVFASRFAQRSIWELTRLLYPSGHSGYLTADSLDVKEINLKCSYFFVLKDGMDKGYGDVNNSIFMIYEIKFTTNLTNEGEVNLADDGKLDIVYLPVYYKEFIKRDSGKIDVKITDANIYSQNESFDDIYRDVVERNKAKYEYEEINY
jgi:hypothetical protein